MGFHFLGEEPTLGIQVGQSIQVDSSRGRSLKKNLNQISKDEKRPES